MGCQHMTVMDNGRYDEDLMECSGIAKAAGVDNGISSDAGYYLKCVMTEPVRSMQHLIPMSSRTLGFW